MPASRREFPEWSQERRRSRAHVRCRAAPAAKEPFRGVFTIPSTPFTSGEIDIPSFRRIIDFCIGCGAHGLVFPVNASEWSL